MTNALLVEYVVPIVWFVALMWLSLRYAPGKA